MASVEFDFTNTTTVITGGCSGIGLACAEAIVKAGGRVVLTASRSKEKTKKAIDRLQLLTASDSYETFACDVGNEASVKTFFDAVLSASTRVDYVIHSAGISPNTEFFEQTQKEWDHVLNTNTTSSFLVVKYAAIAMRNNTLRIGSDCRGKILLVTSTNGVNSWDPVSAHYDASKAACNTLVRVAAEQLMVTDKIWVNGLAPGWINTEMNSTLPDDLRERESAKIWMGRWAEPDEIATSAMQLLTMPYLVGQVVMVDGGYR